ncbi:MAG: DUF6279 family lipoprotein [Polaromonas sp.]
MKLPLNFGRQKPPVAPTRPRAHQRIIGLLGMLAFVLLLQACSVMKLLYNQAPDVAYWYLDGYLKFTDAQSLQVKDGLGRLQGWHRQTQLPSYVEALSRLQMQAGSDISAGSACAVFADVRSKLVAVSERAEPLAAAIVSTLNPEQLKQLERKFTENNAREEAELGDGSGRDRRDKRRKQALNRAEMLYGGLGDRQLAVLDQALEQSRFDARIFQAEKLRRQRDTLQTLASLNAAAPAEKARLALRGLMERVWTSPDAPYRNYLEMMTQESCQIFATLHNSTTAAQRKKAAETLGDYARDFRVLVAQKP